MVINKKAITFLLLAGLAALSSPVWAMNQLSNIEQIARLFFAQQSQTRQSATPLNEQIEDLRATRNTTAFEQGMGPKQQNKPPSTNTTTSAVGRQAPHHSH